MKRVFVTIAAAAAYLATSAVPALATNGYQLIGVGQMQKSMGGAVTAAPMDAMTAITNPAGMARIGERADFSMEAFMPKRSVDFGALGADSTEGGSELYGVPSVGWVANAFERDNFYFGGGMFATSGMGVDYDEIFAIPADAFGPGNPPGDVQFSGFSAIQFWKMAPTVAWNQSDRLSFGVSLNLDYQSIAIKQSLIDHTTPFTMLNMDLGRPTAQMGVGLGAGVLYDLNDMVTIGANYSTQQTFGDAKYRLAEGDLNLTAFGIAGDQPAGTYNMDLQYPQQAALGVSVRPNDSLLVALDLKWINWSSTHDKVNLSGPAGSFGGAGSMDLPFGWDDQIVYALGMQFKATDKLSLRGGVNYSKSPIDDAGAMQNMIFPAIVQTHLGLGADYRLGEHWGVGGTYMKAFKESLTETDPTDLPVTITLSEQSLGLLLYYLF